MLVLRRVRYGRRGLRCDPGLVVSNGRASLGQIMLRRSLTIVEQPAAASRIAGCMAVGYCCCNLGQLHHTDQALRHPMIRKTYTFVNLRAMDKRAPILPSIFALLLAGTALAEPLHDQDNGAIPGVFHFPDSTEGANMPGRGELAFSLTANTSSHAVDTERDDEVLLFDGETTRLEFGFRYGLGSRLEVGIEIPYLWHESGGLDGLIDAWHDTFNLPDGDRSGLPDDQLQIAYQDLSGSRFDLQRNAKGAGDIRLTAGWRIKESRNARTALRFSASVPTGSSEELLGSGGINFSVGLASDIRELMGVEKLNGFYRVHATHIGEPDLLEDLYREFVVQFSAGLGYSVTPGFELRVQTAVRTAVYDSNIEILGDPSATLTFGGNLRLSDHYYLSLAVAEDIKVRSAPDVAFQIALRYWPGS